MNPDWEQAEEVLRHVEIIGNEKNKLVTILEIAEELRCVGIGTDAAVFHYPKTPHYVFKVYSDQALEKKEVEAAVYESLKGSRYFPQCYGVGFNYLVLSFEQGPTLYDCLLQGIPVPEQAILDVEEAREFIRSKGLNPRDIHLKNVLLQEGRGKVLDVSEYVKEGNDHRWEHLLWVYRHFYPMICGVQIPTWIIETINHWYNRMDSTNFAVEDFSKKVIRVFFGGHK